MATWRTYNCNKCGFSIQTEPSGEYALMSGEYINYLCPDCKDIVTVRTWDIEDQGHIHCPQCCKENLVKWNPVSGLCPKCGGKMHEDKICGIIMAD